MSHSFLRRVAEEIEDAPCAPINVTVVLPTKRAGVHLRRILTADSKPPRFLPRIVTLDRWASEMADLDPADPLKTLFTCYDCYRKTMGNSAQDISKFMSWAQVLLGDFNDTEAGLISKKGLYRDLVDYTEIEHFSFLDSPLSDKQQAYRRFWKALPEIHESLNKSLIAEGLAYSGLMMRLASQKVVDYISARPDAYFVIAGLNALSKSEEHIARAVEESGRGSVLFESDRYYLDDKNAHAGLFLRRYAEKGIGKQVVNDQGLDKRSLRINVCTASNKLDQANAVSALLRDDTGYGPMDTAVVLADESMVVPVLQRLPEKTHAVNVTMGVPLSNSSFADWLSHWLDLHETARPKGGGGVRFQLRQAKAFTTHPLSQRLWPRTKIPSGKPEFDAGDFSDPDPLLTQALHVISSDDGIDFHGLISCMEGIYTAVTENGAPTLESRMTALGAKRVVETLLRLRTFDQAVGINLRALRGVLSRAVASSSLSLVGEPMEGLQVMGVLEARALGFKHVILCGADEDSMPGNRHSDSFIPFEVRLHHGMPGRREKESIFAYQFYRLLQNAERFDAVYHTDTEGLSGGEKSRYLLQLEHVLAARNEKVAFGTLATQGAKLALSRPETILEKNPEVLATIEKYLFEGRVSPSSINTYFHSSLEWYYRYVLRFREPENEELTAAEFGTIVHAVLEELYAPYVGLLLTTDALTDMTAVADRELRKQCGILSPSHDFSKGADHVQFVSARRMIETFLKTERRAIENGTQITYLEGEKKLGRDLFVNRGAGTQKIFFTGTTDRVERRDGGLRIIDYKTGNVEQRELKCKALTLDELAKKPKAMQLLLYEWMAQGYYGEDRMTSQIVSLSAPGRTNLMLSIAHGHSHAETEQVLKEIVLSMLDPETPLAANPAFGYAVFEG